MRSSPSFFLSWGWIGTWLETLPPEIKPALLVAEASGKLQGLATLTRCRTTRHHVIESNALHLNETGRPMFDCLTIEHNGILCSDAFKHTILQQAAQFIGQTVQDCDEISLGGIDAALLSPLAPDGLHCRVISTKPAPFADLSRLPDGANSYRESLSKNSRQQINRAIRLMEADGAVTLEEARNVSEARRFFGEMKQLHQEYWTARGLPGSFANPYFEQFHSQLIANRFDQGEIQLLRLTTGKHLVGVLYNFCYRGTVYAYQSGFKYENDNRVKPGLVMHCLAIELNRKRGIERYDFLAGDGQHKRSLSNDACELRWVCLQKPRLLFRLERVLRAAKQYVFNRRPMAGLQ